MLLPRLVLLIICFLFIELSHAETIEGLYESRQKVSNGQQNGQKQELAQSQLIRDAFTHVLIKVSGRQNIAQLPDYARLLANAENAVQLFRYETDEPQEGQADKWFWVRFNENSINKLLQENRIPVWSEVRPSTLVWFSREIDGKRVLQSQYDAPEIYAVLEKQAEFRGIELMFPFMDLQDQSNITAADIWGNFNEPVLAASRRYQSQSTLTLGLSKERSGLWLAQWQFMILGETYHWKTRAEQQEKSLSAGINSLADQLARQFALLIDDSNKNSIMIRINNVASYNQYQRLNDYFATLASVKSISLLQLEQDRVIYNVFYQGDQSFLLREINLGEVLQQVEVTRSFTEEPGAGRDYKAVILDDVETKSVDSSGLQGMGSQRMGSEAEPALQQLIIEKPVELLVPELEYWLAR
jgi:hypothetical protein